MILNPENKNVSESISELWPLIKKYFTAELSYVRITGTEKLTILLSALVVGGILIVLCAMALFYLSLALIFSLHTVVGGYFWALVIVALALLLLGGVIYLLRYSIIVNPIARSLSKLFLDSPNQKTYEEDNDD